MTARLKYYSLTYKKQPDGWMFIITSLTGNLQVSEGYSTKKEAKRAAADICSLIKKDFKLKKI